MKAGSWRVPPIGRACHDQGWIRSFAGIQAARPPSMNEGTRASGFRIRPGATRPLKAYTKYR
jgi:hypothetical protein